MYLWTLSYNIILIQFSCHRRVTLKLSGIACHYRIIQFSVRLKMHDIYHSLICAYNYTHYHLSLQLSNSVDLTSFKFLHRLSDRYSRYSFTLGLIVAMEYRYIARLNTIAFIVSILARV
jgi:hypothetical protein